MNEELNNLQNNGWILQESALKSFENSSTKKNLIKTLLDRDIREYGAGINDLHKGKIENVDYELVVLQILKLRNISAPKFNENSKTAPKLLRLQLTDGQNTYSAIEMEPTALSLETKPGTKISLTVKQLKFANGQLLLTPKNMEILGGNVETLVSKWEISRSLANQMKGNRAGTAAPPFIPFGQKIQQQNLANDRSFKSLQQNKQKEAEENSEFNAQRQDAIAEATKAGTRKTFGGGNKTLIDSNVQKIMDKGYSEEQATTALKYVNNNVEKALINLKKREERQQQRANSSEYNTRENNNSTRDKRGKPSSSSGTEPPPAKPSTGVSLFDFLENKIPESTAKQQSSSSYASHNNERFENNISSSFRKYDKENSNKSQQWSQYSSSSEHKSSQNYNQKSSYNNTRSDYHHRNDGASSKENRSREYKDYNSSSRKYDKDSRDRDNSKYHQSSNYSSSKPNNSSNANAPNSFSKPPPPLMNQKQQSSSSSSTNPHSNNNNGAYSSNNKYEKYEKYEKGKYGQKPDYNNRTNASSSSSKDYSSYSKYDKPQRSNNSSNAQHHQQQSNDMYQKHQQRNVESMEKMNIKGNQHHHHQQQSYKGGYDSYESKASSYQATSNEPKQNYSKPPPQQQQQSNYPIVGFQNKEGNEQAKNALKTKNIPSGAAPANWQQPQQQQQQPQAVSIQVPVISQSHSKAPIPPPFTNSIPQGAAPTQQPPPPPQMHSMQPQPFVQHQVMHTMQPVIATSNPPQAAAVFHASLTYPAPIIMQSVQPPSIQQIQQPAGMQQLKVGDLCLAKYWEDGKFYNAKITGISESTYVVLFTEYGNAEEVRKNDCVPLISTCPTPPMTNFVQPPQMSSYRISSSQQKMAPPPPQQQQQHNYHTQQQQSMPYKASGKSHRRN